MITYLKSIPLTITVSLLALMAFACPGAASGLEYFTTSSPIEQMIQLFSCHLLHWSGEHLFWDLGMFAILGAICERINRKTLAIVILFSAILIPPVVAMCHPAIASYRGLSGIDTALFGLAAVYLALERIKERDRSGAFLYAGLILGMMIKIGHELIAGSTFFVESSNFLPVPIAHVIGAGIGIIAAFSIGKNTRVTTPIIPHNPLEPTDPNSCVLPRG